MGKINKGVILCGVLLLCCAGSSYGAVPWVWTCDAEPTVGGMVNITGAGDYTITTGSVVADLGTVGESCAWDNQAANVGGMYWSPAAAPADHIIEFRMRVDEDDMTPTSGTDYTALNQGPFMIYACDQVGDDDFIRGFYFSLGYIAEASSSSGENAANNVVFDTGAMHTYRLLYDRNATGGPEAVLTVSDGAGGWTDLLTSAVGRTWTGYNVWPDGLFRVGDDQPWCAAGMFTLDYVAANIVETPVLGDTDGDGDINATDLATLGLNWDPTGVNDNTSYDGNFDFPGDSDVDATDLATLGLNWNPVGAGAGATPTPEPATLGVLALGGLAVLVIRRRR